MSFVLVCDKGLFLVTRDYRERSLFAHNHAAPKPHKVHDRVCTEKSPFVCFPSYERLLIYILPPLAPHLRKNLFSFIVPSVHLTRYTFIYFALFVVNVVLTWLFLSFFFGFVVALVLCVKPAPEQQRLDDAIGFLRDHAEVRTAEFQFFFFFLNHPSLIRSLPFRILLRMFTPRDKRQDMSIALFADYAFD